MQPQISQRNPLYAGRRRNLPRLGIVCDLLEENWASMDLVAFMLEQGLRHPGGNVEGVRLCPPMKRRLTRTGKPRPGLMFNGDRILNRFWDYPRWLAAQSCQFDLFHIVDHSYSQMVHYLPAARTIVTCHDLDAFRSVLEPAQERRSLTFRTLVRHTLSGFRKAARITCDTVATKSELLSLGLVDPDRLSVVTNGVHPSCTPDPDLEADREADRLLGARRPHDLLHVGTTIARKRIDVLLEVLVRVRERIPDTRLIRVGGAFTADQTAFIRRARIADAILVLPHLDRSVLASVYRRGSLTLLPSEREGFGLPLIEAMACGTPVIASDLEVLKEVGGDGAEYCAVGDVGSWAATVARLFEEAASDCDAWGRRRQRGIQQASHYTWAEYARRMGAIYSEVLAS